VSVSVCVIVSVCVCGVVVRQWTVKYLTYIEISRLIFEKKVIFFSPE
jgi:hypothetical protein